MEFKWIKSGSDGLESTWVEIKRADPVHGKNIHFFCLYQKEGWSRLLVKNICHFLFIKGTDIDYSLASLERNH